VKAASVFLLVGCCLSTASGQWLETTIHLPDSSEPYAICYSSVSNKVYCANRVTNSVAVIDGETNAILTIVTVDTGPTALCYNPNDNKVYCTNIGVGPMHDGKLTVIDCMTDSVIATLATGFGPCALCYDSVENKIYCANGNSSTATVIDGATDTIIATVPVGDGPGLVCYNSANNKVYFAYCGYVGEVTVIDGATDTIVATVVVGNFPSALCYNPARNKVYCANDWDPALTVIDGATDSVIATVPVSVGPHALCYNPINDEVYCAGWYGLFIVDGATNGVIDTVFAFPSEPRLCHNPTNNKMYLVGSYDDATVVDAATHNVVKTIQIGRGSHDLCYNPVRNRMYVANEEDSSISVLRDVSMDISPVTILSPTGIVDSGTVQVPRAAIRNFGPTSQVFPVTMDIGSGYAQTVQETLAPRMTDTVAFPWWNAGPVGALAVTCITSLVGDEDPTNDTIRDSVRVVPPPRHDVGAVAIVSPTGSVRAGDTVIPKARIKNLGNRSERFFDVRFRIGASYNEKVNVEDALLPDSAAELTFPPWLAEAGDWAVSCSTMLAGDEDSTNDKTSLLLHVSAQTLAIAPDQSDRIETGKSKTYRFYALIQGDTGGVVEVARPSPPPGWSARLCNAAGTQDLSDTDGDGIPDLGYVAPAESSRFSLDVTAPSGTQGDTASLGQEVFLVAGHVGDRPDIADTAVLTLTLVPELSVHNFPNPFSDHTAFVIGLREDGKASLTVYTRTGERICRVLEKADMLAGVHVLRWDGVNDNGRRVAPGTYEYVLDYAHADKSERIHKKLVLTLQ